MLQDFVAKRSARADVTLGVDLFAAEDAAREALAPIVGVPAGDLPFETLLHAKAAASRSTGGFERSLDLRFESDGDEATQARVLALASPPVDSTRRFRRFRVPRPVGALLEEDLYALTSYLSGAATAPAPADGSRYRPRVGRGAEITLRVVGSRRRAVAAAHEALAMLPGYVETRLSSSTGPIELPGRDGSLSLFATLVGTADVTEVALFAGAKPDARAAMQRQLDRVAAELVETTAR